MFPKNAIYLVIRRSNVRQCNGEMHKPRRCCTIISVASTFPSRCCLGPLFPHPFLIRGSEVATERSPSRYRFPQGFLPPFVVGRIREFNVRALRLPNARIFQCVSTRASVRGILKRIVWEVFYLPRGNYKRRILQSVRAARDN